MQIWHKSKHEMINLFIWAPLTMIILATDLDRTLLPNGNQPYDGSMTLFKKIIKEKKIVLIYVTGRNLSLVKKAIHEYHAPRPDYIVAEVGTRIYKKEKQQFKEDKNWIKQIKSLTKNWNIAKFKAELDCIKELKIQERVHQNQFKLSYYIYNLDKAKTIKIMAENIIKKICPDAVLIYSIDETRRLGFLDILPRAATKLTGLNYLRKNIKIRKNNIIYCGDSGNDLLPITSSYKSILVKNAIREVKKNARLLSKQNNNHNLYIAKGNKYLNGNYVSGIIEGLLYFKIIKQEALLKGVKSI